MAGGMCRANSLCSPPDLKELLQKDDLEGFLSALAGDAGTSTDLPALMLQACRRGRRPAFLRALLQEDVDPDFASEPSMRTAAHLAARDGNATALRELLFSKERKGAVANVNALDCKGFTPLHELCNVKPSAEFQIDDCLDVLLSRTDLRVNLKTRQGKTAVYLAAINKHKDAVRRLLEHGALVDVMLYDGDTARAVILKNFPGVFDKKLEDMPVTTGDVQLMDFLYLGDESGFIEALAEMKKTVTNLKLDVDDGLFTLLQKASREGLALAVEALLDNDAKPNKTSKANDMLPTQLAACFGHADVLRILLKRKANVTSSNGITALHYVLQEADPQTSRFDSYKECFEMLVENCRDDINSADDNGNTPLHLAAKYGCEEFVLTLLKNGAYIGSKNIYGIPPIANMSPDTLKTFLDSCISCKKTPRDPSYKIMFDVNFLKPPSNLPHFDEENAVKINLLENQTPPADTTDCECEPLLYISKVKDLRQVLTHPVFTSFLDIKWRGIRPFFWLNLFFYVLFVSLLTIYILFFFESQSTESVEDLVSNDKPALLLDSGNPTRNKTDEIISKPVYESSGKVIFWFLSVLLFVVITLRELFQMIVAPKHYLRSLENYLEICLLIGSGLVLFYEDADLRIRPHISAVTILLSWAELVLLIGKHPRLSTNIEMLKTVSFNFLEFLAWYSLLIIAFALSFFSLFRNSSEEDNFFLNPGSSFFKTVVMVTGEFEAGELPFVMFPGTSHIIFVLFVFLVAIVLFNLLNGLAVSDTQAIREDAELVGIISRINLISYSETILLSHPFWCKGCQNPDSCFFQAFTGLQKLSLSRLTAQIQKVKLFPLVLPEGIISVLPNQEGELDFSLSNTYTARGNSCYSPLLCHYYLDSVIIKAAEKILESKRKQSSNCLQKCNHEEMINKLESKIETLNENDRKTQETLQKVLQLLENSYNAQKSQQ